MTPLSRKSKSSSSSSSSQCSFWFSFLDCKNISSLLRLHHADLIFSWNWLTDLQHPVLISPPDLHMQQLQLPRVVVTYIPQNSQQQEQTEDLTEL
jgi:hypothetical protein